MFEVINLSNQLSDNGVKIIFVRQPELSTAGPHGKLLLAIYSYFAESERDFISLRTKTGLAAARASGIKLGRPKGARSKNRILDPYQGQIADYLKMGLNLTAIHKIVNHQLPKPITYQALKYFVERDSELATLRQAKKSV